ncbi:MAG: hypothetical protein ACYTGC_07870 [Planctomycetota bacterium]|jgi:hypothetical protein
MAVAIRNVVRDLDRRKTEFGPEAERRKLELLRAVQGRRLEHAADVVRLHEALCFVRAYPDSAKVLGLVEDLLAGFADRSDVRRYREDLRDSGIAGTQTCFRFFPGPALWLAKRCGEGLAIDWEEVEHLAKLEELLEQIALYAETPGLDEYGYTVREWIDVLKGPQETDAAFLLRRLAQLPMDGFALEALLEDLDLPFVLSPGPDTPARTNEKYHAAPVVYRSGPLRRSRPKLAEELAHPPASVRRLTAREGRKIVDLARAAMVARCRGLNAFTYAQEQDVRLVDCGEGLQFALIGVAPQRRLLLESIYAFVMLSNGVPLGYGTHTMLMGSSEIAYTIFDTFRSGESAVMFERALALARHLFGIDCFSLHPYQIGYNNEDAVRSGAWWFYQKLGFRPLETDLLRIMRHEVKRQKASAAYRSSPSTLRQLAESGLYLYLDRPREDVIGLLSTGNVGLAVTRFVRGRFGYDRRRAEKQCAREAAKVLGVRSTRGFTAGERLAWARWSPLILVLPGVSRWGRDDKRALVRVVRAKGGPRESEYLQRFDEHRRLRRAIVKLAADDQAG